MLRKNVSFLVVRGDEPPPTPDPKGSPPAPEPKKSFSQEDVNKFLADEKRKWQSKEKELIGKVEALNLTAAQKTELEAQFEELRVQSLSKEEQAKDSLTKLQKKYEKELKEAASSRDSILSLYTSEKIERDILAAASMKEVDAVNPEQMVRLLAGQTRVADELDDEKKPTGRKVTRIKMRTKKEGKEVELDLSPVEALKAMKEDPNSWNLFNQGQTPGSGGSHRSVGGSGPKGFGDLSVDEIRKKYQEGSFRE